MLSKFVILTNFGLELLSSLFLIAANNDRLLSLTKIMINFSKKKQKTVFPNVNVVIIESLFVIKYGNKHHCKGKTHFEKKVANTGFVLQWTSCLPFLS